MKPEDYFRIQDMIKHSQEAIDFLGDMDFAAYEKDNRTFRACERCLEIIGEAASKITNDTRKKYISIEWQKAIAMRNLLIHGYNGIRNNIVFETIKNTLPNLIQDLANIIKNFDIGEEA